jgi:hypothetical protein
MTTVLIPLHFNQYKAIQNIHKNRDVRSDVPKDEEAEYLALKNNYDIIYEYMINKNPEQLKDGDELIFEERKSIRDTKGTGKILARRNRIKTNYLGTKARVKPTEGELPPRPPSPEPESEEEEEETKEEWIAENPKPDMEQYYWWSSFLHNNGVKAENVDFVVGKIDEEDDWDWFMAVQTYGEPDYNNILRQKNPRPIWTIDEEYKDVHKILASESKYSMKGYAFSEKNYYVWSYEFKKIMTQKEVWKIYEEERDGKVELSLGVAEQPLKPDYNQDLATQKKTEFLQQNPQPSLDSLYDEWEIEGSKTALFLLDNLKTDEPYDFRWYISIAPQKFIWDLTENESVDTYKVDWEKMEIYKKGTEIRFPFVLTNTKKEKVLSRYEYNKLKKEKEEKEREAKEKRKLEKTNAVYQIYLKEKGKKPKDYTEKGGTDFAFWSWVADNYELNEEEDEYVFLLEE